MVLLRFEDLTRLHEDTLHHLPVVILAGGSHAVHLLLPMDGPPILLPGHREEDVGGGMLEAHLIIPHPVGPTAHHRPVIQVVSLTSLPEGAHLLWMKMSLFRGWKRRELGNVELDPEEKKGSKTKGVGEKGRICLGLGLCYDLKDLVRIQVPGGKGELVGTREQDDAGSDPVGTREHSSAGGGTRNKDNPV